MKFTSELKQRSCIGSQEYQTKMYVIYVRMPILAIDGVVPEKVRYAWAPQYFCVPWRINQNEL